MIRRKTVLEKIMMFLTGKRKYHCRDCSHAFRMPERRSLPREAPPLESSARQRSR